MHSELFYIIALMNIKGVGSILARHLIDIFGSAEAVFKANATELNNIPRIGTTILEQRGNNALFELAEKELQFIEQHNIRALVYGDSDYPKRLLECDDAPALLYCLGNADLNAKHIVGIVGTRSCTQYGRENVEKLVRGLKEALPDIVIVSGLALGIDITSHVAALNEHATTFGVVAHGLDQIYPSIHKSTARQMIADGGAILTEYSSGTRPERGNFLARNRIIAGLCDALVVAESKDKGGSLVTASIALDYNREVFAFPGRTTDDRSLGCNRLIRLNRAGLITCADDLLEAMGWAHTSHNDRAIQQSIPFEEENLTPNSRLILDTLRDRGDLRLSQLSELTGIDTATLMEELLDLELSDRLRATPSGLYQLR
ncbi:MAG: DNA-processing protein DprA [Bacteroidales bacterium]|nr:DNA-processing protein DprA [Bacteroidales bacterium]